MDDEYSPRSPTCGLSGWMGVELVLRPKTIQSNARQRNQIHEQIRALEAQYDRVTVPIEILHGHWTPRFPQNPCRGLKIA